MLARDQPTLAIAGEPVRIVRWLAIDIGAPARLVPAQDPIVGNVATKQRAHIPEPDRPLTPARAGVEPLDARLRDAIARKARVEDLHPRVRIARAFLPGGEGRAGQGCHGGCA